jgi:E3 ubiquitin-protein ligase MYCBP2
MADEAPTLCCACDNPRKLQTFELHCGHFICPLCFASFTSRQLAETPNAKQVKCPVCPEVMTEQDICLFDPSLVGLLASQTGEPVHECPRCHVAFLYEPGPVAGITVDGRLDCGHPCCGVRDERAHVGCAECDGLYCGCGEECSRKPSIMLECGHPAHVECVEKIFATTSPTGKIKLPRCIRPGCQAIPKHPMFQRQFDMWRPIAEEIEGLMPRIIADEKIEQEQEHVNNPQCDAYYRKPLAYARDVCVFYMCHKCRHPFYGGRVECGGAEQPDTEYTCVTCSRQFSTQNCPRHGDAGMLFKCFWCCKPGLFFCWGTTHFCAQCHVEPVKAQKGPWVQCDGKCQFCPHPPNGTKKIFGYCTICEEERARRGGR